MNLNNFAFWLSGLGAGLMASHIYKLWYPNNSIWLLLAATVFTPLFGYALWVSSTQTNTPARGQDD